MQHRNLYVYDGPSRSVFASFKSAVPNLTVNQSWTAAIIRLAGRYGRYGYRRIWEGYG
jgi:hypothetical protein